MANRTVKDAHSVKGTNPQYLVEKIIRTRIYECKYWKEQCFALTAELLVDKAMELKYVGGIYGGNIKPTPFICLILKMLQIQPEKDIIVEFISQQGFKYVRALGAIYMRLTGTSLDCFKYLEPLYNDYRKMKRQNRNGEFELFHMDEFIDELIREERSCDIILPRLQKRQVLEENNQLEQRVSFLDEEMDDMEESEEEEEGEMKDNLHVPAERTLDWDKPKRSPSPKFRRSRSRSPKRRHRSRSRERHRDRDRHRDRGDRHRSRSKDRHRSHRHRHRDDEDRHRHHRSKKSRRDRDRDQKDGADADPEIQEANALRASLGLAPLK